MNPHSKRGCKGSGFSLNEIIICLKEKFIEMNRKNIFIAVISLMVLSFVMIQCTKEVSKDTNNIELQNRSTTVVKPYKGEIAKLDVNSDCNTEEFGCIPHIDTVYIVPNLPNAISGITIPDGLIEDGCKIGGIFTYKICPDDIKFVDYVFFIGSECSSLKDFMNGLSSTDYTIFYEFLSNLIQGLGMQAIVQDYADDLPEVVIVHTNVYQPLCYMGCKICTYEKEDADPPVGGPSSLIQKSNTTSENNNNNRLSLEMRGGKGGDGCKGGTWLYHKSRCGNGCCITTIIYEKNQYGVMEVKSKDVASFGNCESSSILDGGCIGEVVDSCAYHCE